MIQTFAKAFSTLTPDELYEILRVRSAVFLVEQHIHYLDMDGTDREALHVFMREGAEIIAYARVFRGEAEGEVHMGRVLTTRRKCGYGREIVRAALRIAFDKLNAQVVTIDSQSYVADFYRRLGFRQTSEVFILEGIPHVRMELERNDWEKA